MEKDLLNQIRRGYDVFGKEYGFMLRNDLHDKNAIEHRLMQEQILLDATSEQILYDGHRIIYPMKEHELYPFSQQFKANTELDTIRSLAKYTSEIALNYDVPLENMSFGGTEKEILDRGTDWCFDIARLAAVILDCIGLTSRFIFVANPDKAYHGHVLLEAYYNNSWGVVDPLYGNVFYDKKPISAKDISFSAQLQEMDDDYKNMFKQIAIAEYNPIDSSNKYIVSKCNTYTYNLNNIKQDGTWKFGEGKSD
ncbi:MAG: transglutaminase domain-containing protein [Christensenellales bacterium]